MLPARRDPYELLGVPPDSDREAIKRAFRLRARRFHPDISDDPEAERKFREATDAYRALLEPGPERVAARSSGRRRAGARRRSAVEEEALSALSRDELYELWDLTRHRRRGPDVLASVALDLEEADRGTVRGVALTTDRRCEACHGSGSSGGAPCERCEGAGKLATTRVVQLRVPAGAVDGERLRLAGEGHCGDAGGEPGDAFLVLRVDALPDARLTRYASLVGLVLAIAFLVYLLAF